MKIALDVMGGDHAPRAPLAGVVKAVRDGIVAPEHVVLIGDKASIEQELKLLGSATPFEIVHASENIGMDEHPAQALRKKRDSTIVVGAGLLKEKRVGAFLSAGNTGAAVGAATLLVKLLDGVRRPGIAVTFGTAKGPCTLIDVGANVHCQPEDLYTYGEMASDFMRAVYGIERPRVGLLNIGQEDAKGNDLTKKTQAMLRESRLNFVGNVEGQNLFEGSCDVVVCEGFVGNVVLKVSEGLGQFMARSFHESVKRHAGVAGGNALEQATREVLRRTDYAEYGGAPLLGVDGLVIICHGRSDERAIANAFRVARQFLEADVNRRIVEELARRPNRDGAKGGGG